MITVGATILALFPLAIEGGPLWKPLCYAQIGGLAVVTFITLLGPGFLLDLCARSKVDQMGDGWRQIGARTARAQNHVTKISLDHQILLMERQRSPSDSSV
jgi:hypothetical protein